MPIKSNYSLQLMHAYIIIQQLFVWMMFHSVVFFWYESWCHFQASILQQMVNCWFGARWFGFLESPYERDCSLGVPRFESQTTGPQTNHYPLVDSGIRRWRPKPETRTFPKSNFSVTQGVCHQNILNMNWFTNGGLNFYKCVSYLVLLNLLPIPSMYFYGKCR